MQGMKRNEALGSQLARSELLVRVSSAVLCSLPLVPFMTGCTGTGMATYPQTLSGNRVVPRLPRYPEPGNEGAAIQRSVVEVGCGRSLAASAVQTMGRRVAQTEVLLRARPNWRFYRVA